MFIYGNHVGVQADFNKNVPQTQFESQEKHRKSFKLTHRPSSKLQVKENNFLNRGDCGHTVGVAYLSKKWSKFLLIYKIYVINFSFWYDNKK